MVWPAVFSLHLYGSLLVSTVLIPSHTQRLPPPAGLRARSTCVRTVFPAHGLCFHGGRNTSTDSARAPRSPFRPSSLPRAAQMGATQEQPPFGRTNKVCKCLGPLSKPTRSVRSTAGLPYRSRSVRLLSQVACCQGTTFRHFRSSARGVLGWWPPLAMVPTESVS